MAGKGVPGVGRHILYPATQDTLRHIQVTCRLLHGYAAFRHQLYRLKLELSAEHPSLRENLR